MEMNNEGEYVLYKDTKEQENRIKCLIKSEKDLLHKNFDLHNRVFYWKSQAYHTISMVIFSVIILLITLWN